MVVLKDYVIYARIDEKIIVLVEAENEEQAYELAKGPVQEKLLEIADKIKEMATPESSRISDVLEKG